MSALMWLMMRGQRAQPSPMQAPVSTVGVGPSRGRLLSALLCCFNWRVYAGLAIVGVGVWLLLPGLALGALPVLLAVACPLSMLVLMVRKRDGHGAADQAAGLEPAGLDLSRLELAGEPAPPTSAAAAEGVLVGADSPRP